MARTSSCFSLLVSVIVLRIAQRTLQLQPMQAAPVASAPSQRAFTASLPHMNLGSFRRLRSVCSHVTCTCGAQRVTGAYVTEFCVHVLVRAVRGEYCMSAQLSASQCTVQDAHREVVSAPTQVASRSLTGSLSRYAFICSRNFTLLQIPVAYSRPVLNSLMTVKIS